MAETQDHSASAPSGSLRTDLRSSGGWIALGIGLLVIFLYTAAHIPVSLIFGVFLYYGTRPIYKRLRDLDISRTISATTTLLLIGLPVLIVTFLLITTAFNEAFVLAEQGDITQFQPLIDRIGIEPVDLTEYGSITDFLMSDGFRNVLVESWGTVSSLTNTFIGVLFSIFLSFTFAFFMYGWGPEVRKEALKIVEDDNNILRNFIDELDRDLAAVFFGNMLNAVVTSIIGAVVYTGLNTFSPSHAAVPVPILLGLLTGIASFVPMVGSKIVYVPVTGLLLVQSFLGGEAAGYGFALMFFGAAFVIVDTLPDVVLRPLISGRSTSQGALFLGYTLGPIVFGFVGVFLFPIVIVTFLNFHRIVVPGFYRTAEED